MVVAGPHYECIYANVGVNDRCSDEEFGVIQNFQNNLTKVVSRILTQRS